MSKNLTVTKSNDLINASYHLTTGEQKIILMLASMVQPDDEDFFSYEIKINDFVNLLEIKGTSKYTEIQKISKELMKKVFTIKNDKDKEILQIAWLSSVLYKTGEGVVRLRFDPSLKPFLLQLKERFTSYKLQNILQLKSSYSIRIYELLKQFEGIGERTFTVNELKEKLGLGKKQYKNFNDFKRFILQKSQGELEEKTDISFNFKEIKKSSKKVEKIIFYIYKNGEKANKEKLFLRLLESGIGKNKAEEIFLRFDRERIKSNLNYVLEKDKQGKVKENGLSGYIIRAVENNYAADKPRTGIVDSPKKSEDSEDRYKGPEEIDPEMAEENKRKIREIIDGLTKKS